MRAEQVKIRQLSELGDFVEKVEAEGFETIALAHSGAVLMQGSGETITTYTVIFRSLADNPVASTEQAGSEMPSMNIDVTGLGEGKEVEWSLDELGAAVSLQELIVRAQKEFPGIGLSDLIVCGSASFSSGRMDYDGSAVTLRHQKGWW